jgi:hypothetical protein
MSFDEEQPDIHRFGKRPQTRDDPHRLDRRESILLNSVTKLFSTAVSCVFSPNNTFLVSPSICDVDSSFLNCCSRDKMDGRCLFFGD